MVALGVSQVTGEPFRGKVALITGSSRGIGRAIALRLAAEGCKVVINHLGDPENAADTLSELKRLGSAAVAIESDVSSETGVKAMVEQIHTEIGPIDILVNNARFDPFPAPSHGASPLPVPPAETLTAVPSSGPAETPAETAAETASAAASAAASARPSTGVTAMPSETAASVSPETEPIHRQAEWWERNLQVNLRSAFLLTWAVLPSMMDRGFGRIINIASLQAHMGSEGERLIPYATSKAGLVGLTKSFAKLAAPYGVTVNCISPGTIETGLLSSRVPPDQLERLRSTIPVGRFGQPEEVAECVVFLGRVGFITGETIHCNGGVHMA